MLSCSLLGLGPKKWGWWRVIGGARVAMNCVWKGESALVPTIRSGSLAPPGQVRSPGQASGLTLGGAGPGRSESHSGRPVLSSMWSPGQASGLTLRGAGSGQCESHELLNVAW